MTGQHQPQPAIGATDPGRWTAVDEVFTVSDPDQGRIAMASLARLARTSTNPFQPGSPYRLPTTTQHVDDGPTGAGR